MIACQTACVACYFKFANNKIYEAFNAHLNYRHESLLQVRQSRGAGQAPGQSVGTTNTENLTWLFTLHDTMVAPCRLMVQVVLLPLSMGTTGTWPAIFVIPPFQKHFLLHSTRVPSSSQTGQLRHRQRPARVGLSQL